MGSCSMLWRSLASGAVVCLCAAAQDPGEQVFRLTYRAGGFSLYLDDAAQNVEPVLRKEPRYEGAVVRGAFPTGRDAGTYTAFAADMGARMLYVDANRNLDLTDDVPYGPAAASYQQFNLDDVKLAGSGGPAPAYRAGLMAWPGSRWSLSSSTSSYTVNVLSGWRGPITLGDTSWHTAVIDNLDGAITRDDILVLAPPDSIAGFTGTVDANRLPAAPRLCLNGQVYDLSFVFVPGQDGAPPDLELHVHAQPASAPALVPLAITGTGIARLVLSGAECTVVADAPGSQILVPPGRYERQDVYVQETKGYRGTHHASNRTALVVPERGGVALALGGPLQPTAELYASGRTVALAPRTVGVGDETYQLIKTDQRGAPPTFAVYAGDQLVGSGSFEYG